jgi:hypothetical protein
MIGRMLGELYLPYCLDVTPEGYLMLLNRDYHLVGRTTLLSRKFSAKQLAGFRCECRPTKEPPAPGDRVYFYCDGCNPFRIEKKRAAYFARLQPLLLRRTEAD